MEPGSRDPVHRRSGGREEPRRNDEPYVAAAERLVLADVSGRARPAGRIDSGDGSHRIEGRDRQGKGEFGEPCHRGDRGEAGAAC